MLRLCGAYGASRGGEIGTWRLRDVGYLSGAYSLFPAVDYFGKMN